MLIAASAVQNAEAVLVGLALRCQDATATRNIPQLVRTTEAVTALMLKRTFVRQLNLVVVLGEALHVATAFLFMYFRKCTC